MLLHDDRPLKKYCLTSVYKDIMDWIRGELIDNIKECTQEMAGQIGKVLDRLGFYS